MLKNLTRSSLATIGITAVTVIVMLGSASAAFASSTSVNSRTLPYTSDYIQTNTWVGNYLTFNASSSSYLWGTNPGNAYLIEDTDTITANGVAVSLSDTGGAISTNSNSATYDCQSYNNWYCGNTMYNIVANGWAVWSKTGTDTTKVVVWANTQSYYNSASTTNYW